APLRRAASLSLCRSSCRSARAPARGLSRGQVPDSWVVSVSLSMVQLFGDQFRSVDRDARGRHRQIGLTPSHCSARPCPAPSRRTLLTVDEHVFDSSRHAVRMQAGRSSSRDPEKRAGHSGMFNPMTAPEDICIPSRGEQLAAYLYRPESPHGDVPCVVMAHGFSATRDDGLPAYAEAFRDAGFAVVLFDYRHFGASTGEPRQLIDIGRQHDDYRAVVSWVRMLDGVDPRRIVLFGSSFAAVIAQAPYTASVPTLAKVPPVTALRATALGIRDELLSRRGGAPVVI